MKDFKKFASIIAGLGEIYERPVSKELTELYWRVLNKYSDNDFESGVERMLKDRTLQKFPKPAEIIKYIEGKTAIDNLALEEKAEVAWQTVVKAMSDHGAWQSVIFDDKVIMGVIEAIGGWRELCMTETDKLVWKQKEFVKLYCIDKKAGIDRGVDKLIGNFELTNGERGLKAKSPILIRDNGKPKQIGAKHEKNMVREG